MRRRIVLRLVVFLLLVTFYVRLSATEERHWLVYYSDQSPVSAFDSYSLLVFNADRHPPLHPLGERGKVLLGYLSLGEVAKTNSYFDEVRAQGILLRQNANWRGSYSVDLRDKRWVSRVIHQLIPDILHDGFDGIFLDTLDDAIELERVSPKEFNGMTKAAAQLVRTVRHHYPSIKIMMNRGYRLLPLVEQHIDMVLGESMLAGYDFRRESYSLAPSTEYLQQVRLLKEAQSRRPQLQVFTLDYWNPDDAAGIARIYREQRANGFEPYVATINLDRIIKEPAQ